MAVRFPKLPEGQRWKVVPAGRFFYVKLQEKRWWGWRTVASSIGAASAGEYEVSRCIDRVVNRARWARLRAEVAAERGAARSQIPYGTH